MNFKKLFYSIIIGFFVISDNFADYKRLRGGVYFLESFPMTPSGKVLRRRIKDIVTQLYENENGVVDS